MRKSPNYSVWVYEIPNAAFVCLDRGNEPWERAWVRRFHRDEQVRLDLSVEQGERGWEQVWVRWRVLNSWLRKRNDMPAVRIVATGLTKTAALELAASERKWLRERGIKIDDRGSNKPSKRRVLYGALDYESASAAARAFHVTPETIRNWVRDPEKPEWDWIEE